MRDLEEPGIPRFLFLNKIDNAHRERARARWRCCRPRRARRCSCARSRSGRDGIAVGYIDLALERAFIYREHAPSEVVAIPADEVAPEREARFSMLETPGRL